MTVRERKYIETQIVQFERWCKNEQEEARRSDDQEEKDEHYDQAKLHGSAADALNSLLICLKNKDYQV